MSTGSVAVTGASGFIGRALVEALAGAGSPVRAISRRPAPAALPAVISWGRLSDYEDAAGLAGHLAGVGCVVHLADDPERRAARAGEGARIAGSLTRAMREAGVTRLVLASSVYAGRATAPGSYGEAKRRVEEAVLAAPGLAPVILRLPPVYGPGGRGGFAALTALVRRGLPLPFALARAPRAYLSRRNLCDLVVAIVQVEAARWDAAAGRIFEPSDGAPVSTAELARMIAGALGRRAWLVPVPLAALRGFGRLAGRGDMVATALDPLEVAGNDPLAEAFGWTPAERMPASLAFLRASGRA